MIHPPPHKASTHVICLKAGYDESSKVSKSYLAERIGADFIHKLAFELGLGGWNGEKWKWKQGVPPGEQAHRGL